MNMIYKKNNTEVFISLTSLTSLFTSLLTIVFKFVTYSTFVTFSFLCLLQNLSQADENVSTANIKQNIYFHFLNQQEFSNLKATEQTKYIQLVRETMIQIESSLATSNKKTAHWSQKKYWLSLLYQNFAYAENNDSSQYVSIRRRVSDDATTELGRISEMFLFVDVYGRAIKQRQSLGEKVPGSVAEAVKTYWTAYDRMVEISKKPFTSKYEMDYFLLNLDQLEEYLPTIKSLDPSQSAKATLIRDFVTVAKQRTKSKTLDPKELETFRKTNAATKMTTPTTAPTVNLQTVNAQAQSICNGFLTTSTSCDSIKNRSNWSFKIDDSTLITSDNLQCQTPFRICNPFLFGYEIKNKKIVPICVLKTDSNSACKNLSFDTTGEINQRIQNLWQKNPSAYQNLRTQLWNLCSNSSANDVLKNTCATATSKFNAAAKNFTDPLKDQTGSAPSSTIKTSN